MLQVPRRPYTGGVDLPRRIAAASIGCAAAIAAAGCNQVGPSYDDPTPEARLGAIRDTATHGSTQDIPRLIENLSADDASVRFAAITELRRLNGTTNGYDYRSLEPERVAAINRWKDWLAQQPAPR